MFALANRAAANTPVEFMHPPEVTLQVVEKVSGSKLKFGRRSSSSGACVVVLSRAFVHCLNSLTDPRPFASLPLDDCFASGPCLCACVGRNSHDALPPPPSAPAVLAIDCFTSPIWRLTRLVAQSTKTFWN